MFNNIILPVMAWTTDVVGGFVTKLKEERGQDIMEYAVLAGGIALVAGVVIFGASAAGIDILQAVEDFGTAVQNCISMNGECGS